MREITRVLQIIVVSLFLYGVAAAQPVDWTGAYEFHENGGKNAGGAVILISHELNVIDSGDGLTATLQSNGYQTSADLVCTAKAEPTRLSIYFQNYGEDNMFEPYQPGDLLLTLERRIEKGKPVIITNWGKFTPAVQKNEKPGKQYFEKVKQTR